MTVGELIEELRKVDPNATVAILLDDEDIARGDGIYTPLFIPDDGDMTDKIAFLNIGMRGVPTY